MERKQMLMAGFAIFTVILFIYELFAFGFLNTGSTGFIQNNNIGQADVKTEVGIANFTGKLKYYESYLIANVLNESQTQKIKENKKIIDVVNAQQGFVIEVKSKEDVEEVYYYLKDLGIKTNATAVFSSPSVIEVMFTDRRVIETSGNERFVLKLFIEPTIAQETDVKMQMNVIVQNSIINNFGNLKIVEEKLELNANAMIEKLEEIKQQFSVPWENRNEIDKENITKQYKKTEYVKNDYLLFSRSLTEKELLEKKNLSYITFISEGSASVKTDFTDKDRINEDFKNENITITYPNSMLSINSNDSVELLYEVKRSYIYTLKLPEMIQNYSIPKTSTTWEFDSVKNTGEEIPVNITIRVIGQKVLSITSIKLNSP